ncbi:MAG: efflux RND transporter periplasmic adaptor subunit [Candidatus Glassbacteria bacterium]
MTTRIQLNTILRSIIPFIFLAFSFLAFAAGCGRESRAEDQDKAASADTSATARTDSTTGDLLAAKGDEQAANAVPVEVDSVRRGEVYDFILQNASVETENGVEVFSRLVGEVVALSVEEGSRVRQGDELCRLEDDDYRLTRDKAKVVYEKKKSDCERLENMFGKQLVSEKELEEARFNLDQARIEWEQASLNLRRTRITAPISGVVTNRHVKLGERVTTSEPVFKIVEMDEKIAVVHLPERETGRVTTGQRAFLQTDNLPDQRFEATVKRVSPVMDAASGTFKVTVGVKDLRNLLKPGMYVAVHIITDTHSAALLIPKAAVVYDNGLPYAYFVREDTLAGRVRLEKGYSDTKNIEVLAGVAEHDRVIVIGQKGLKDGARIKIIAGILDIDREVTSRDTLLSEGTL